MKNTSIPSLAAACLMASALSSQAISVDLTTIFSSGSANGGRFVSIDSGSTGTGVIDPFVRIQNGTTESGYNTGLGTPLDTKAGIWTHELLLGDVPVVTIGLTNYYQFLLDINENKGSDNEFLTLHALQIFLKDGVVSPANTYANLTSQATKVWDLDLGPDGDSKIELNYSLNPGSGYGDMFAYIPVSAVGTDLTKNLYLFSTFGPSNDSDAGFEEWAVLEPGTGGAGGVPDGGTTLASLGVALLGLGWMRRLFPAKA